MGKLEMFLSAYKKPSWFRIILLRTELVLGLTLASLLAAPPCSAQSSDAK